MMVLWVIGIILGILLFVVGLPYCMNNRKVIYARNRNYFNALIAYCFSSCVVAGICTLGFGCVSLMMPQLNIGNKAQSLEIIGCGLAIFAVGVLIGIIPIKKAKKDGQKGVVKDMIIAAIGSMTAVWMKFIPFIVDYSQKKYEQYLAEEKQREAIRRAEQERIDNSYVVNKETGERYSLNSDGTAFRNADGEWVKVSEAIRTGNYKIVE